MIDRDATMAFSSDDGFLVRTLWHARLDARECALADRGVDQRRGIKPRPQPAVLGEEVAQPVEFRAIDLELRRHRAVRDDFREIGCRRRVAVAEPGDAARERDDGLAVVEGMRKGLYLRGPES